MTINIPLKKEIKKLNNQIDVLNTNLRNCEKKNKEFEEIIEEEKLKQNKVAKEIEMNYNEKSKLEKEHDSNIKHLTQIQAKMVDFEAKKIKIENLKKQNENFYRNVEILNLSNQDQQKNNALYSELFRNIKV